MLRTSLMLLLYLTSCTFPFLLLNKRYTNFHLLPNQKRRMLKAQMPILLIPKWIDNDISTTHQLLWNLHNDIIWICHCHIKKRVYSMILTPKVINFHLLLSFTRNLLLLYQTSTCRLCLQFEWKRAYSSTISLEKHIT